MAGEMVPGSPGVGPVTTAARAERRRLEQLRVAGYREFDQIPGSPSMYAGFGYVQLEAWMAAVHCAHCRQIHSTRYSEDLRAYVLEPMPGCPGYEPIALVMKEPEPEVES